ncbi:MAG: hypothetical protein FJW26_13970 [Acidimicrobiia bacterium]|nr:hypothetical protein [Acidimicrobiia bacterium]
MGDFDGALKRLIRTLAPYEPYLRGVPPGRLFLWSEETVWNGLNFSLATSLGSLDLFGEITGGGDYEDLLPDTITLDLFGVQCFCLSLTKLIEVKRAAGRPKDLQAVAELEALAEER